MKNFFLIFLSVFLNLNALAQNTFPINGVANSFNATHVFRNATLVISPLETINNGTLIIKDDKILSASAS